MKILMLKPYLEYKIWGGKKLSDFNYNLNFDKVGEAFLISAIESRSSIITNINSKENDLYNFFKKNRDFFGGYHGEYPLLTKIIDANDDLSVQVHPDDEYAMLKHNSLGKSEFWYILDCEPNSEIIYGITTKNRFESEKMIKNGEWDNFLKTKKIKKGDCVYVPAGMVHAIKKGILLYEIQQSSDITYRLFDYNRIENGKKRDLHIEDSLNVIKYEFDSIKGEQEEYLINNKYFKLLKIVNHKNEHKNIMFNNAFWTEVTVIDGEGFIDAFSIRKGNAFIIKSGESAILKGEITILVSYIEKNN